MLRNASSVTREVLRSDRSASIFPANSPSMATQVLCAWCEAERRAVPSDELERLNHRSALGGMCWTHALTQLLRTRSTPGASLDGRRFLVVVERKSDALFVRLSELLLDEPRIQVIVARRQSEGRQRDLPPLADRRQGDRRGLTGSGGDRGVHPAFTAPPQPHPDL